MHLYNGFFSEKKIRHFSTAGNTKAALVERFDRTLKGRMYRYFTGANTLRNATLHRSIGMAPQDLTKNNEAQV